MHNTYDYVYVYMLVFISILLNQDIQLFFCYLIINKYTNLSMIY